MKTNFHTHSVWCDGADTPETIVQAAIERGFSTIGFSSHAMLPGDPLDWPLTTARMPDYVAAVREVAARHASRIRVLCGVEADYVRGISSPDRSVYAAFKLDYVIGSVHFVVAPDGAMVPVDHTPELLIAGIGEHFGGDARAFVQSYFEQQREMVATCDFDVIGHPDLCRKFNGKLAYFDPQADWYQSELESTAATFAASGKIVEVNTGAIARGWMDDAYPAADFRERLRARGVRFILSSDSHAATTLDCAFARFATAEQYIGTL